MRKKSIFVCLTIRHLFYSISISISKNINATIIFCVNHQKLSEDDLDFDYLSSLGVKVVFFDEERYFNHGLFSRFPYIGKYYKFNRVKLECVLNLIYSDLKSEEVDIVDDIYIYHERTLVSKAILKNRDAHLIEDGLANYRKQKVSYVYVSFLYRIFKGYNPFSQIMGEHNNIKTVYLSSPDLAFSEISKKVKDLKQEYILNDFLISNLKKIFLSKVGVDNIENDSIVLLTQPIDWAGFCTTSLKLEIYQDIVNIAFMNGFIVYIKPHPRESLSEYQGLKNTGFLNPKIPLELMSAYFNDNKIRYYSLYTSAEFLSDGKFEKVVNLIENDEDWQEDNIKNIGECAVEKIKKYTR